MPVLTYYDPNASRIRAETLRDFLRAPLTGNVEEVPGVGKDTKAKLLRAGVASTQQLIGVYLKGGDCGAFYKWLQGVGVSAHRNTVVRCISEKAEQMCLAPACHTIAEDAEEVEDVPLPPTRRRVKK